MRMGQKWKHVNVRASFHRCDCVCDLRMAQNGWVNVAIGANANRTVESKILHSGFKRPIRVFGQAFPRKNRSEVERVSETHGCRIRYRMRH